MVYRQTARSEKIRAAARTRLLRGARKLFVERGYDQTTMQDIVREAKTSIGNAYFYFSNKEDLLESLLGDAENAIWARADSVIASVEPGAPRIAVAFYANALSYMTSEKDVARIAVTGPPNVLRHFLELHLTKIVALVADNFPDRSESEVLMSAVAVGGASRYAVELWLMGGLNVPARELADFLIRWHLRAFDLAEPEIERALQIADRALKLPSADNQSRRRTSPQREATQAR